MTSTTSINGNMAPSPLVVGSPALRQPASLSLLPSPRTTSPLMPYPTPISSLSMGTPDFATDTSKSLELAFHRYLGVVLRVLTFLFSFFSSLTMAVPSAKRGPKEEFFNFNQHPEFIYYLVVAIVSSMYSAVQLLKGVWDELAYKGFIVSTKIYDYLTFFFDQMMAYLLFSSSILAVYGTGRIKSTAFRSAIMASLVLSFSAFVVMAASALRSGYRLSKRIGW